MATTKTGLRTIVTESGNFVFVNYLVLLLGRSGVTPTEILHRVGHTVSVGTRVLEVTTQLPFANEDKQPLRVISRWTFANKKVPKAGDRTVYEPIARYFKCTAMN